MNQKSQPRRALRLALVIAADVAVAGCVRQDVKSNSRSVPTDDMVVVTSGAEVEFARTACGQLNLFSGRLRYKPTDAKASPIRDAAFWVATTDGPRTRLAITVTEDGAFEQSMGIIGGEYLVLSQDGSFPADSHGALPIVVTANGCSDYRLSYSSDWVAKDLYLECPGR